MNPSNFAFMQAACCSLVAEQVHQNARKMEYALKYFGCAHFFLNKLTRKVRSAWKEQVCICYDDLANARNVS